MNAPARTVRAVLLVMLAAIASVATGAQPPASSSHHAIVAPDDIQWKPLRPGAEIAVVSGDPNKAGSPFVMRFRYRGVARIPPHWHPTDEHITVLSGTFFLGMGERADASTAKPLAAGGYAAVSAKMPHYAWTKGDTLVQIHGIGPFAINYVNPEDDPNGGAKK